MLKGLLRATLIAAALGLAGSGGAALALDKVKVGKSSGPMILAGRYGGRLLCFLVVLRRNLCWFGFGVGCLVRRGALPEFLGLTPNFIWGLPFQLLITSVLS